MTCSRWDLPNKLQK